jgi:hypothetical protein
LRKSFKRLSAALIISISTLIIIVYLLYSGNLIGNPDGNNENDYSATIADLHIMNSLGQNVERIRTGDTIIFSTSISNIGIESKELFLILEVRNETSDIIDSGINGSEFSPSEEKTIGIGWLAKSKGIYTVIAYVAEDFEGNKKSSVIESLVFEVGS